MNVIFLQLFDQELSQLKVNMSMLQVEHQEIHPDYLKCKQELETATQTIDHLEKKIIETNKLLADQYQTMITWNESYIDRNTSGRRKQNCSSLSLEELRFDLIAKVFLFQTRMTLYSLNDRIRVKSGKWTMIRFVHWTVKYSSQSLDFENGKKSRRKNIPQFLKKIFNPDNSATRRKSLLSENFERDDLKRSPAVCFAAVLPTGSVAEWVNWEKKITFFSSVQLKTRFLCLFRTWAMQKFTLWLFIHLELCWQLVAATIRLSCGKFQVQPLQVDTRVWALVQLRSPFSISMEKT